MRSEDPTMSTCSENSKQCRHASTKIVIVDQDEDFVIRLDTLESAGTEFHSHAFIQKGGLTSHRCRIVFHIFRLKHEESDLFRKGKFTNCCRHIRGTYITATLIVA